jgi:uncharacterized SAM-binding protein YcdF (DUF218 family)
MFYLKRLLECLFLPPFAPLLLIILGLCLLRWRPRLGLGIAWGGVFLSLALMLPFTVASLLKPIEDVAVPLDLKTAKSAQAIVILSGGIRVNAPEYGRPTLNRLTLERVRYGAKLARETGLPILVSGGLASANYSEALLMSKSLKEDFSITPLWLEDRSENTEQNAIYSAALLKEAGIDHILLVTHAAHMRRALAYFKASGLHVTPAPTAFLAPVPDPGAPSSWIPSAGAAYAGWYAAHEWAGLLQQKLSK